MKLNFTPHLLRRSGSLLLLGLLTTAARAQGPWVPTNSPFTGIIGSLSTSVATLKLVEPTTLWGWARTTGAGGTFSDRLAVSTDLGQSWQLSEVAHTYRVTITTYGGDRLIDAWMSDAQHGSVISEDVATGTITYKRTTTGPSGFQTIPAPSGLTDVRFFSPSIGIVVAEKGTAATGWTLYRTADEGNTWQTVSSVLPHLANDRVYGVAVLGTSMWLTTTKGQLLRTADTGQTWTITTLPTGGLPGKLAFRDASNGLLLTVANTLLSTTDGGQSWQPVASSGPRRSEGLVAVPGSAGTYVSFDGLCNGSSCPIKGSAISLDNGLTWRELENSIYHTAMVLSPSARAWSAGYSLANMYTSPNVVLATAAARPTGSDRAWPNPATGQLHFTAQPQPRQITLFDATGRQQAAYTLPAQATTLELTGCAPGLYLLKYQVGSRLYAERLLVTNP